MRRRTVFVALFVWAGWLGHAAQPIRFNYQAKLKDSIGSPLQGTHTLYFKLFSGGDAATADSGALQFEESASTALADGIVIHSVGTGSNIIGGALSQSLFHTNADLFLQVSVDSEGNPILPRTRLDSVPFAISSADADARIPIAGPLPVTITQPGSYYLTQNLVGVAGQDGITIASPRVNIDLQGFTLSGVPGSLSGINCLTTTTQLTNLSVQNGTVESWDQNGVNLFFATPISIAAGGEIRNVKAMNNGLHGITAGTGSLVENCVAESNNRFGNRSGIFASISCTVNRCVCSYNTPKATGSAYGILTEGTCIITDNICYRNNAGNGNDTAYGIDAGPECHVVHNFCCENNVNTTYSASSYGIYCESASEIIDNSVSNNMGYNAADYAYGIFSLGSCLIRGNHCANNIGGTFACGIAIFAGTDSRVENNLCTGHDNGSHNGAGIYIEVDQQIAIINNSTSNNARGISIINPSSRIYYSGNTLADTTAIFDGGTGDVAGSNVIY